MIPSWLDLFRERAPRMTVPPFLRPAPNARPAAVLILFGEGVDGPDVLLLERAATLKKHAGQPAFPGGSLDPEDDGPVGAALREAEEETGVDPSGVTVLSALPELYLSRSDFRVTPVAAWWHTPCAIAPGHPGEVASVTRVPIAELVDPDNRVALRAPGGFVGPAFKVRDMLVWGFTAGLLTTVLDAGGWAVPWDQSRVEDLPPEVISLAARG
ncbi:CoA pyrophosphatase [Actinocorallia sp. API 0066]|nr:CoA pyrophosphatase [Actinocorallia sp. API 0066]MCD0450629.1 CoA pyrophosphatase [Actinocorallia sp. API 0066]